MVPSNIISAKVTVAFMDSFRLVLYTRASGETRSSCINLRKLLEFR